MEETQLDIMQRQLDRMETDVKFLRETVEKLIGGIAAAQNAGGMPGMMARQLPDMRQMVKFDEVV